MIYHSILNKFGSNLRCGYGKFVLIYHSILDTFGSKPSLWIPYPSLLLGILQINDDEDEFDNTTVVVFSAQSLLLCIPQTSSWYTTKFLLVNTNT